MLPSTVVLVRDEGVAGSNSDQYLAEFHQSSGTDYGTDTSLVFAFAKAQYRKHCMCCIAPPLQQ
jgi:hypothetical protein